MNNTVNEEQSSRLSQGVVSKDNSLKAEFTPSPWRAGIGDRLSDGSDCWVVDSEQGSIAELMCSADVAEANARLIAAAPMLYEALKLHMEWIGPAPVDAHSYDSLREDAWRKGRIALAMVNMPEREAETDRAKPKE